MKDAGGCVQILDTQQQLLRAKAEEEARGQAAADARRWNGLRNIVEARALLKAVFRVASNQRAQVRPKLEDSKSIAIGCPV